MRREEQCALVTACQVAACVRFDRVFAQYSERGTLKEAPLANGRRASAETMPFAVQSVRQSARPISRCRRNATEERRCPNTCAFKPSRQMRALARGCECRRTCP